MKLLAVGVVEIDEFGSFSTVIKKTDPYKHAYSSHLSGRIKYTNLPEGTKVKVTIEVIEDGDGCQ